MATSNNKKSTSSSSSSTTTTTTRTKSERQKRHERARVSGGGFSMNIKIEMLAGILLAIIGTFIIFAGDGKTFIPIVTKIISVVLICLGVVAIARYFKYKNSGTSLIVGIIQVVIGLALFIFSGQLALWIFLILGIVLALYGLFTLIRSRGRTLDVILGIVYIVLGALVILYAVCGDMEWMNSFGKYIIGVAAYIGAVFFLIL